MYACTAAQYAYRPKARLFPVHQELGSRTDLELKVGLLGCSSIPCVQNLFFGLRTCMYV